MNDLTLTNTKLIRTTGGKRMVHTITCPYIQGWDIEGCEPIEKVKFNKMNLCPTCGKSVIMMEGAADWDKHQKEYENLFSTVSLSKVKTLYISQKVKTTLDLVNKKLHIKTKNDHWYIDFSDTTRLFHGNYNVSARESSVTENFQKAGYHEHERFGETFSTAIGYIIRYDYKKAEKVHKDQRKKQRKKTFADINAAAYDYESKDMM